MIKRLNDALFANDDIIFINKDSNNITFSLSFTLTLSVDLDQIHPDDVDFDEDDQGLT